MVERIAGENPLKVIVIDNLYLGKKDNLNVAAELLGGRLKCYWESASNEARMRDIIGNEEVEIVYNLAVIPLPASLEEPSWAMMENTALVTVLCELQHLAKSLITLVPPYYRHLGTPIAAYMQPLTACGSPLVGNRGHLI